MSADRELSGKERLQNQVLAAPTWSVGSNVAAAPLANTAIGTPGSFPRKIMEKTVGLASERLLPPYARQRFSTWFKKRTRREAATVDGVQGRVALFPTCLVEYQNPAVGQDLVKVLRAQRDRVLAARG